MTRGVREEGGEGDMLGFRDPLGLVLRFFNVVLAVEAAPRPRKNAGVGIGPADIVVACKHPLLPLGLWIPSLPPCPLCDGTKLQVSQEDS